MRGFRLKEWQRFGIVFSLAWALAAVGYTLESWHNYKDKIDRIYFDCVFTPGAATSTCDAKDEERQIQAREYAGGVLLLGLTPIPIAWLLAYAGELLVRWIRRGFQPSA